jgi:tetratricopeptide (TPR) repeat protein
MPRLSDRAFNILQTEIKSCCSNDFAGKVQQELALKRLEKFRLQEGTPLSYEELREALSDLFPSFNDQVLRAAARENRPPTGASFPWGMVKFSTIALVTLTGGVWFLNLPYPPIRWSVARTAPILLLPSFMSMDRNYREAIVNVEQADQLVNSATSQDDLGLGSTKVKAAQKNLDALPVWFMGYYPAQYCSWFQCGWRFTLDEFRAARENVARMEATLFQEQNAYAQLEQGDQAIGEAQAAYDQSADQTSRNQAIAQWQTAIDTLKQIPPQTLASRMANSKLEAYERDFQQVVGFTIDNLRAGKLMGASRQFAAKATQLAKNAPNSLAELGEIKSLWETAIERLEKISETDPDYVGAQKQLADYQTFLSQVRVRIQNEKEAVQAFEEAQRLTQNLLAVTANEPQRVDRGRVMAGLQEIIHELGKVKPGTTKYSDAQKLMQSARNRLK